MKLVLAFTIFSFGVASTQAEEIVALRVGGEQLRADATTEFALSNFPAEAGSLEIRFRPLFAPSSAEAERTVLTLTGERAHEANAARIDFGFVPQGVRWQFTATDGKWRRSCAASNFKPETAERWNQLVLTWDKKSADGPVLRLYRDGRYDRHRTEKFEADFTKLSKLSVGGSAESRTAIDEIVVYRSALDAADVALLHAEAASDDRIAKLAAQRIAAARLAEQAKRARRDQIEKLQGKVAYLINPRGGTPRDYRLPGGITAKGVRVEDVGKVDLTQFAVIYGPPGAGYQLTKDQDQLIRDYVAAGGGYVGVCAGANYAGRAKLLNMTTHSLRNQGLVTIGVEPHPVTQGFAGEVVMHHGNGPIMVPGEGCTLIGAFLFGGKFPIKTAAIAAGTNGRGRVVAFGPHPTGGNVEHQSRGTKFTGSDLGTDTLLINALLWAAKVID